MSSSRLSGQWSCQRLTTVSASRPGPATLRGIGSSGVLPTNTSVGMNVLSPVAQGDRLQVAGVFQGFKTGEFTVKSPDTRVRAMGSRSAGKQALPLKLADVCEAITTKLTKD